MIISFEFRMGYRDEDQREGALYFIYAKVLPGRGIPFLAT